MHIRGAAQNLLYIKYSAVAIKKVTLDLNAAVVTISPFLQAMLKTSVFL